MKVFISPDFGEEDRGDGGIRRVVEAQRLLLPNYGVEVVKDIDKSDLIAMHAGALVKVNRPVVAHCHGLYWNGFGWAKWAHDLNKAVITSMRVAEAVTAPSKWVARVLQRGMWINPYVVYHGINADEWLPDTDQHYVLWNKTRIDPICTPEPLNRLADMAPGIDFVSTFGSNLPNMKLVGRVPYAQSKPLVQHAGVYLCTSLETFGIGTLEAMSCGVPVLGWDFGGQSEIVTHKVDGWLAPPGDYNSLLEGLYYCIDNRAQLSEAARHTVVTKFGWPHFIEQYANIYKSALEGTIKPVKVSVIVPCYNLGHLLPTALNSLIAQTMPDWECIIVNDASPDNTQEIAQQYCDMDSRFKLITHTTNTYVAGALNDGTAAAQGQYVLNLDADNSLPPKALEILSGALDKNRELMIVYGSMEVVEEDGKHWISPWPPSQFNYGRQMDHQNQIPSTSLCRKRVWETVGGYRHRCRTGEDPDFWCRATSYGFKPAKVTDEVTLIYLNRHNSMSHVEADWPYQKWYSWYNNSNLAPITAPMEIPNVPLYGPLKVTVVIPVGPGHELLVQDAIDSVNSQTLLEWECIIVDDTGGKIRWVPPSFKLLTTGMVGAGPAVARNIGIRASTTKLFVPLDADDYLQPTALELLVGAWEQVGGYVYTDWIKQETQAIQETPEYNCESIYQKLPHAVTAIYPKSAWTDVGGFDEQLTAWEDWDFVLAINNAGYCGTRLAVPLFHYRMESGTRREEMYAKRETLKEQIYSKWIKDNKMPCGGCGKGGGKKIAAPAPVTRNTSNQSEPEVVTLEFIKPNSPPLTYRGAVTNTLYRFGSDPGHKTRNVYKADAPEFLRRSEFKLVGGGTIELEKLEAAGPPTR